MGRLVSIAYSSGHGLPRPLHKEATIVANHGIDGDLRAGRAHHRHLNIMDAETIEQLKTEGFPVGPGIMGENLIVEGVQLDQRPQGTRIRIGQDVVAETTGLREPCINLTPVDERMPDAVVGRVGVLATVIAGGAISVGDRVELMS